MKLYKNTLAFLALMVIFGVSFFMGRLTAVRRSGEKLSAEMAENERAVAILPLLRSSEATGVSPSEPLVQRPQAVLSAAPDEEVEEEAEEPPSDVSYPADGSISKPYSLQSVYSETMKDWRTHQGMDMEAPLASAVTAAADGVVARAYEDRLWGKVIEIEHRGGLTTVYKGVSTLDMVKEGKLVKEGDVISGVGTMPVESKAMPHLHFETWLNGVCVNPECFLRDN